MTRHEFLNRFIRVRKCPGCGEILPPSLRDTAFCEECRIEWNAALTYSCGNCFKSAPQCECMPKSLSRAGALCLRRVFFYDKDESYSAPMSTLFWLKYKKSKRVVRFVGEYLAKNIKDELESFGYPEGSESFAVTFVPRSRRSRLVYGFDQSAMLAENVSKRLGIRCVSAFRSVSKSQQKKLGGKLRAANAQKSIGLKRGVDLCGKYVLIIDDVVTTGASMVACTRLLQKAGARGVLCFALTTKNKM